MKMIITIESAVAKDKNFNPEKYKQRSPEPRLEQASDDNSPINSLICLASLPLPGANVAVDEIDQRPT